ncbi:palindromic element RPE3 domain-containing protein [Rickettsia endosymbiont of Aspidapion aeneum]|uniref:palindromic element RPE3 domain-containing protein n=1 Tax=Rickettsia endosymbiont of Aspidapion aeneum TaxID=3066247 RepID=UPI00313AA449
MLGFLLSSLLFVVQWIAFLNFTYYWLQLNSESFRQDEFEEGPAQRTGVREYRRMPKNLLVSSDRDDAVPQSVSVSWSTKPCCVKRKNALDVIPA